MQLEATPRQLERRRCSDHPACAPFPTLVPKVKRSALGTSLPVETLFRSKAAHTAENARSWTGLGKRPAGQSSGTVTSITAPRCPILAVCRCYFGDTLFNLTDSIGIVPPMKWFPWPIYSGIFIALNLFPPWVPDERRPGTLADALICLFIGAVLSVLGAASYYFVWRPLNKRVGYYWNCIIFVAGMLPVGATLHYLGSFMEPFGNLYYQTWDSLFAYAYLGGFVLTADDDEPESEKKPDRTV